MTTAGTRLRPRVAGVADPSTISGLQVWLRAADIAQADASAVASWVDHKSSLNFAQATGANQPTYQATGFNGLPCVRFDGTNDSLSVTSSLLAVTSRTVLIACADGSTAVQGFLSLDSATNWYVGSNGARMMRSVYTDAVPATQTIPVTLGQQFSSATRRLVLCYLTDTSGGNVRILMRSNGATRKDSTSATGHTTPGSTAIRVGSSTSAANPMNGDIAELLAYSRALTLAELLSVERYLANKYGITV